MKLEETNEIRGIADEMLWYLFDMDDVARKLHRLANSIDQKLSDIPDTYIYNEDA